MSPSLRTPPIVDTTKGSVRGFWRGDAPLNMCGNPEEVRDFGADVRATEGEFAAFLGIPFAQPPVGPLRFRAPVPVEPWEGVKDATRYGATPCQHPNMESLIPEPVVRGSSTLNLNVFTPDVDADLPVLVYIHGGSYVSGSPDSPWYDGRTFNRDGIVTVSISYRLGFDGFGEIVGAPSNRGVLDWIAALQWVRDNIAAFGGNPRNVTIVGQSAGGGAVLTLLGVEQAQSLFSQAWSISGVTADIPLDVARRRSVKLAELAGVSPTVDGFSSVPERTLSELQDRVGPDPAKEPRKAVRAMIQGDMNWGPVVDGKIIARPTLESLGQGVGADKPLLMGTTTEEFTFMTESAPSIMKVLPKGVLRRIAGIDRKTWNAYRGANAGNLGDPRVLLGQLMTDGTFRARLVEMSRTRGNASTWTYSFEWRAPSKGRSFHCLDLPFWFDCLDQPYARWLAGGDLPRSLARLMHDDAVSFIRDGNPGWQPWSGNHEVSAVYGTDPLGRRGIDSTAYASVEALTHRQAHHQ